jgi:hypothetical protein
VTGSQATLETSVVRRASSSVMYIILCVAREYLAYDPSSVQYKIAKSFAAEIGAKGAGSLTFGFDYLNNMH